MMIVVMTHKNIQGNAREAIKYFTKAYDNCRIARFSAQILSNRAYAYLQLRQYQKAHDDAAHCLQLDPRWFPAYFYQSSALRFLGRFQEALDVHHAAASSLETKDLDPHQPGRSFDPGVKREMQTLMYTLPHLINNHKVVQSIKDAKTLEEARDRLKIALAPTNNLTELTRFHAQDDNDYDGDDDNVKHKDKKNNEEANLSKAIQKSLLPFYLAELIDAFRKHLFQTNPFLPRDKLAEFRRLHRHSISPPSRSELLEAFRLEIPTPDPANYQWAFAGEQLDRINFELTGKYRAIDKASQDEWQGQIPPSSESFDITDIINMCYGTRQTLTPFAYFALHTYGAGLNAGMGDDVWTKELTNALAEYLAQRCQELNITKENCTLGTIVEVGAGDGRLSYYLNQTGKIPVPILATDKFQFDSQIEQSFIGTDADDEAFCAISEEGKMLLQQLAEDEEEDEDEDEDEDENEEEDQGKHDDDDDAEKEKESRKDDQKEKESDHNDGSDGEKSSEQEGKQKQKKLKETERKGPQVEQATQAETLNKYRPSIIICAWMTEDQDWTALWRRYKSVQEYILLGDCERGTAGKRWETFGLLDSQQHGTSPASVELKLIADEGKGVPPYAKDLFEKHYLDDQVGCWQLNHKDCDEVFGHSRTVSFRRSALGQDRALNIHCNYPKCPQIKMASQRCSRCKQVQYCSKQHQKQDWKQHKKECSPI